MAPPSSLRAAVASEAHAVACVQPEWVGAVCAARVEGRVGLPPRFLCPPRPRPAAELRLSPACIARALRC
eukprot:5660526-Prymnesium_polylepis.2